jgi:hypothetical protein
VPTPLNFAIYAVRSAPAGSSAWGPRHSSVARSERDWKEEQPQCVTPEWHPFGECEPRGWHYVVKLRVMVDVATRIWAHSTAGH